MRSQTTRTWKLELYAWRLRYWWRYLPFNNKVSWIILAAGVALIVRIIIGASVG